MTTTQTRPAKFQIGEQVRDHVWFRVLHGSDKGVDVAIPLYHQEYSEELVRELCALDEGDVVEATLQSRGEERIAWRVNDLIDTDVYGVKP